ncbi:HAUS augmin-like complex subunit 6 N-terminus-domain-containing protein [Venturia nashicola]|uniref:HAUS augmin-like complex subunit 6 N-terminus-domain-containing protein n=1 Tax=Venturia nashicola TaxID=86259 RepID=A0A4Z1PEZ9_9PEZI|nr:HAUS augmin-like complex subunit 6 N-terminus-domain-containing protein [Venturia nashicola]TLD36443.1 HAUS augmin-like complex subunit 6 N-terminus-domain-containing protein [Venturia nashicola]
MLPPAVPSNTTSFVDHGELFATNLRLLNLDLLADWPAITTKTFSITDAQQNQKQRIRCTEWALFRLFELWDPQETQHKLLPFFPPLEPLQSLNLRAALFRSLNDLKKSGILGRETVLRKTMLDECKGDKLMEVLIMFSTAVLRTVESRYANSRKSPVSAGLAVANVVDASLLLPLAVAHGACLSRLADRREEQNNRYTQFNNLLDGKYLQLQERLEASESVRRPHTADADGNQVHKVLHQNWSGNTPWATIILCGEDNANTGDSPLEMSFDGVWQAVSEGTQMEEACGVEKVGLLENLESRIQKQAKRSQNWQTFLHRMTANQRSAAQTATQKSLLSNKGMPAVHAFKFGQHQHLQMGTCRPTEDASSSPPLSGLIAQEHQTIMMDVQRDLVAASTSRRDGGKGWSTARTTSGMTLAPASAYSHDIFSPVKPTESQLYAARATVDITIERPSILTNRPSFPAPFKTSRYVTQPPMSALSLPAPLQLARTLTRPLVSEDRTRMAPPPSRLPVTEEPIVQAGFAQRGPIESPAQSPEEPSYSRFGERSIRPRSDQESGGALVNVLKMAPEQLPRNKQIENSMERPIPRPARLPSPDLSETSSEDETAAEQIIASVVNATPSPVKMGPRMTLTERTRQSMAPVLPLRPDEDDKVDSAVFLPEVDNTHLSRRMSLADRTRQSMASMTTHTHKSRKSLDLRKQRRTSQFPVNQFETPGKPRLTVSDGRPDATPVDKLFSEEADYDSVFKTRPKVALSPVWSPDTSSLNLDEAMSGEGGEEVWENSPLANRRLATNTTSG